MNSPKLTRAPPRAAASSEALLAYSEALPTGSKALPAGSEALPAGSEVLIDCQNRLTDGRMEILPILQDFVPYQGRCPASIKITEKKTIGKTVEQGQGTADHLMPLGN